MPGITQKSKALFSERVCVDGMHVVYRESSTGYFSFIQIFQGTGNNAALCFRCGVFRKSSSRVCYEGIFAGWVRSHAVFERRIFSIMRIFERKIFSFLGFS